MVIHPLDQKHNILIKRYNISLTLYNELLEKQNHCCNLCGLHTSNFKRKFAVDHDHRTGKIRSLLCNNCNIGLGNFKEDSRLLWKAI